MGFTFKITYTCRVLNPVETLWRLPRVTRIAKRLRLSARGVLRCGRPLWLWGVAFRCRRALGGDSVPRTFHSMKAPYRLGHCAHQERTWRKTQAPLSQNMPRNSPTRCADMVTSAHGRADSLCISCLWVQRRVPRRDREGVHGEPRGHSYANWALWRSIGGRRG